MQCPKFQDLLKYPDLAPTECRSFPQTHNSSLYSGHCAQKKAQVYSNWVSYRLQQQASEPYPATVTAAAHAQQNPL